MSELKVTRYVAKKSLDIYHVGNYEIEAGFLWAGLSELHEYEEDGRGSHRVEFELYEPLLAIGVVERRPYGKVAPTASFDAFYQQCVTLATNRTTPNQPYVWKTATDQG